MKAITLVLLSVGVVACTAPSQGLLNATTQACNQGDRNACTQLPMINAQVQAENQNNQIMTGVAAGAGGLVGGAVLGGAFGPHYYGYPYYHHCWGCW
ncbi:MAG: hypothetical protein JO110_12060 [Acetobacteraceae bacterium]|nr:hypothetical protein [Acetobacteraceae bacterium]